MRRWTVIGFLVGGAAFLTATLSAPSAFAKIEMAADLDYAAPINSDVSSGGGFGVRLGYQAHAPLVVITPELGFTYDSFSGFADARVYRGLGGLRIGIGEILRPGVFGHLGIGQFHTDLSGLSHTDLTYDAGAFLDLTVLPLLTVGAHVAYNRLTGDPINLQWMTVGGHVALVF